MSTFDEAAFETLMRQSTGLQHTGEYKDALAANLEAYKMAPDPSFEKGRAARDAAARLDRLGELQNAELFALEGFAIRSQLLLGMDIPSREAQRERAASAMFMGAIGLRKAIHTEINGEDVNNTGFLDYLRNSLEDLKAARAQSDGINKIVDQYQINATRRVSMAESLFGNRKKGALLGFQAVGFALISESLKLDTANPSLTLKERLPLRKKVLLGGIAALSVNLLASPQENMRRRFALNIADKAL